MRQATGLVTAGGTAVVRDIEGWVTGQGLRRAPVSTLFHGFFERLDGIGVRVSRGFAAFPTLHPVYAGYSLVWRPSQETVVDPFFRLADSADPEAWLRSPMRYLLENRLERLHCRLDGSSGVHFLLFDELRAEGGVDYYLTGIAWSDRPAPYADTGGNVDGIMFSFVSDRPDGFAAAEIALIDSLVPALALAMRVALTHEVAGTVLEAYIGRDAGRRVLDGQIVLGDLHQLKAVLFFADLRGFTRLADVIDGQEMVTLLNRYLDRIGRPVVAHGGEILKFMGDGLLAVFEIDGDAREVACLKALQTTVDVYRGIGAMNRERAAQGLPVMQLDLALHLGDVYYGNVGMTGRMDFTVIGPAVNEASRIEALCKQVGRSILTSESFYRAVAECCDSLVPVGSYELRDIRGERTLYTLRPELLAGED